MIFSLRKYRYKPKLKKGLSLIEIVIVITIIGILAGVGIPAMLGYIRKSKFSATETSLRNVKNEIMRYYSDTGEYPNSLENLISRPENVPSRKWHGPYFDKMPKDGWSHEIEYQPVKSGAHPFELFSWGPEGVDSSEENISVWDL